MSKLTTDTGKKMALRRVPKVETSGISKVALAEIQSRLESILSKSLGIGNTITERIAQQTYGIDSVPARVTKSGVAESGDDVERMLAMSFADITDALMEVHGLTPERIERIKKSNQMVAPGYVPKEGPDGEGLWDYFVAVTPDSIAPLEAIISTMCNATLDNRAVNRLVSTMQQLTMSLSGDEISGEDSLHEYLSRVLAIPLAENTVLNKTLNELKSFMLGDRSEEFDAFRKEICRSSTFLRMVRNGEKVDDLENDLVWDEARGYWSWKNERNFKWMYQPPSGTGFIYVPLEYFPR